MGEDGREDKSKWNTKDDLIENKKKGPYWYYLALCFDIYAYQINILIFK